MVVIIVLGISIGEGEWNPPYLGDWVRSHYSVAKWEFFLLLSTMVVWYRRALTRRLGILGLLCKGCHRPLMGRAGQAALGTGKCRHCGAPI